MVILIWAGAVGGLLFSLVDLLAKAGAGWSAPAWVLPAGVVCLAGAFLLSLVAGRR